MELCPECGHPLPDHDPLCKFGLELPEKESGGEEDEELERWDGMG